MTKAQSPARKKTTKVARKKAAAKKKVSKRPKSSPDPFAPLSINGEMFWRWRALSAELLENREKLQRIEAQYNLEASNPVHKPLLMLEGERNEAQVELNAARLAFVELQKEVARQVGLPYEGLLKRSYTINPDSGCVVFLPEQQEG